MTDHVYYQPYDWYFVTGDYAYVRIQFKDPDPTDPTPETPSLPLVPRVWDGWSVRAQARKDTKRETEILATLECAFEDDGFILVEFQAEETAKVLKVTPWDLELTDPDGKPDTPVGGKCYPKLDVTR